MSPTEFIKITEPKQTTEKTVQRKPSVEELTTVESPGKPSPASMLEEDKPKKAKKKIFASSKNSSSHTILDNNTKIAAPKKDSILIITEKPQAAQKIAFALGKPNKITDAGVSYYELENDGKKIIVASAVGHLFNLTYKAGQKGWPLFELEWQPSYEREKSAFTKRYFDTLKKLSRKAKEIIVATDYDIEGEVIGWNVLRFICKEKNAKRMKYSTLTSEELQKSFSNLQPELNWGNAYAGETRHFLDWLYGINLSRALMSAIKTTGSFKILSIGRVQGPALKIIVEREHEIQKFKPEPYWQVIAFSDGIHFTHPRDIFDSSVLDKFKEVKNALAKTKKTEESISPPVPFDLTTLQREAYRLYKMNPSETLTVAQKLYLDGLISYPRTSSQKIPKEIEPKKILKNLEKHFSEAKNAKRSNPVEGKKSDPAHPSIYPTGEFSQLDGKEEKLYNLIAKRFIACFSDDAKTANKRIVLTAQDEKGKTLTYSILNSAKIKKMNEEGEEIEEGEESESKKEIDITFSASGLEILDKGWTSFYPIKLEENILPDISGLVNIDEIKILDKETSPPPRYSAASLVSLLEKKNLGTKATRSAIVDTLFARGYLDGKSIQATQLGIRLIEALEKYSPIIIDENLTRQLEEEMEKIQQSTDNFEKKEIAVIEKAKRLISDISKEFKFQESNIGQELLKGIEHQRSAEREANTLMQCPTCKKGNLRIIYSKKTRRQFVACSGYPECKQTYSLPPNALIKKADNKICPADNFPKLLAIRKGKRPWEFCFNPQCPEEKAKREEWEAKKLNKTQDSESE